MHVNSIQSLTGCMELGRAKSCGELTGPALGRYLAQADGMRKLAATKKAQKSASDCGDTLYRQTQWEVELRTFGRVSGETEVGQNVTYYASVPKQPGGRDSDLLMPGFSNAPCTTLIDSADFAISSHWSTASRLRRTEWDLAPEQATIRSQSPASPALPSQQGQPGRARAARSPLLHRTHAPCPAWDGVLSRALHFQRHRPPPFSRC